MKPLTVDELVEMISNKDGTIYPFSYAANMMAAHGVNEKLVAYFHAAAADQNRASTDRSMILSDYRNGKPYDEAARASFLRWNPHLADEELVAVEEVLLDDDAFDQLVDDASHAVNNLIPDAVLEKLSAEQRSDLLVSINDVLTPVLREAMEGQL